MFTSTSIGNSGTRIVQLGLASNPALALIKLASGWALRSKSLTADAWHSFGDLIVDCLALFALLLTSLLYKNTNDEVVSARIERLLSMAAAGLLIYTASHIGWESLLALKSYPVEHALINVMISNHTIVFYDHHHGSEVDKSPSIQAIWPAALTFVVKEWLYRASKSTEPQT
jgi:divalent metal cation (Fe/Co/Zn/Cd) transporter